MKYKSAIFLFGFFLIFFQSLSQQELKKFGDVGMDEITMSSYKADPGVEALVLFDQGKTYFSATRDGFEVVYERHTRIKIFTSAGFDYAEIVIPFYQKKNIFERIIDLEGNSYNAVNGKIVTTSLDPSQIYTQKTNDDWYMQKIAIPEIKEGSIIEYRYKIVSPLLFHLRSWQFQCKIPTLYSELLFSSNPFYEYTYVMQNASKFDFYESGTENDWEKYFGGIAYKDIITRFGMKNTPGFRDVSFITTESDYLMKLDFQLSKVTNTQGISIPIVETWDKMVCDLNSDQDFGKFISAATRISKDIIERKGISNLSDPEKFSFVVDYVKALLRWNGECRIYATKKVAVLLEEKSGNSSEINLFLTGMLNAAGFEAYPVLISTRDHGRLKVDYPFLNFFNYVVVLLNVNNKWILTDATDPYCPQQHLPPRCLNGKGLVIREKKSEFVFLEEKDPSLLQEDFFIQINPETDSMVTDLTMKYTLYESMKLKSDFSDKKEDIEADFRNRGYDLLGEIQTNGYDETESPYLIHCKVASIPEWIDGALYVSPFLSEPITENPFGKSSRKHPIDINYPKRRVFKSTILIPEGYYVEKLPTPYQMEKSSVQFSYSAVTKDRTIEVMASYSLKSTEYPASDLLTLKFLYIDIIKRLNEKIILIKEKAY